ncbi:MAG: hypothetical protein AAFU79_20625, partial [Myxococcota bacterium]
GFEELRALQPAVAKLGLEADSPAGPVGEVVEWLVSAAHARLAGSAPDCAECVEPLLERAQARRSPADEMLERAEATGDSQDALERVRVRCPD